MKILYDILKKKQKSLIIADDSVGIWGIIAEKNGISTEHHFPKDTPLKNILQFGRKQNCRSVLFLQTADIRELDVKLGQDLDKSERRSAVLYAAASSMGDHTGSQCISYMDGMFHDFKSSILVSGFDTEELISINALVKSMKMQFLGITNFKQLLLAQHFSDPAHHNIAFLFFLGSHALAAIPERNKVSIRNLPFGVPEKEPDAEWLERAQRRLSPLLNNKRVCLYSPENMQRAASLLQELCNAESMEIMDWEKSVSGASLYFLNNNGKLIHPALLPPKEKDPKASGTFMGLFLIVATLLSLGFLIGKNYWAMYNFQQEIRKNQEKIDRVKKERDILKTLEKDLVKEQELFLVLKQKERVSRNYLLILNLLSRYHLQYSKITSITEKKTGIYIQGESIYQRDLSRFFTHFEKELNKYSLTLFSDSLSKEKDGRIIFSVHTALSGGNK